VFLLGEQHVPMKIEGLWGLRCKWNLSRTSHISNHPKFPAYVNTYKSLDHIASLAFGNCRDLSHVFKFFIHFLKKSCTSHWEISVSCTTSHECNVVTTPYYLISTLLSSGHLKEVKNKRNFKLIALKVVAVSYKRYHFQEVPNIVIWLGNSWYFGKLVTEQRWSQLEAWLYSEKGLQERNVIWIIAFLR